jgi:hypothetical protein
MNNVIQIIGALGIGGLISSYLTLLWKNRQQDARNRQDYKEQRYKCIVMLLHAHLNFQRNVSQLNKYGYDIASPEDLTDLLEAELINSYLFASQEFITTLQVTERD